MPIRTRTHDPSPYFQTDDALQNAKDDEVQPVSLGSATKPVDWRRTKRTERTPLARPKSSSHVGAPKRKPAPVVDASDSFLGVFLPRPSVSLTRSSYSDIRPADVKATQNFKRPTSAKSTTSEKHRSRAATEIYKDGLAPDFQPIELVSVELLFNPPPAEQEPAVAPSTTDAASIAPESEIGLTEDRPGTPSTPKKRKSFNFTSRLSVFGSPQQPTSPSLTSSPSRRSIFGGKSKNLAPAPPLPRSPSPVPSSRLDAETSLTRDASTTGDELLPPKPAFLRDSASRRSFSSRRGSDAASTIDQATPRISTSSSRPETSTKTPKSPASVLTQTASSLPRSKPAPATTSFKPKMTTILSRFSSRQMGDHKCRRGYPIAVFAGAQSMDVGSITNSQVEGSYSLFFGPGHPQNLQKLMSESELKPSHLQNPKPPTTAATGRRAELIATTRALQAIHDLYQGKACAHICMDSAYVAKAWGSWIPKWEEEGWPGDEHVKRRKDSGYRGSGSVSEVDEPVKRSSKRLADEDLLRQLAAIRRLYARAERKGTGAAHLYLIDKNVNPAHKSARQILDNTKVMAASSPTQSRRESMTASRASMSVDGGASALGVPRHRRQRSMLSSTGSQRHSKRGSVDLASEAGERERERGTRGSRHRSTSMLKAAPALQEETPSEIAAPSAVEEGTVLLERRPSVKSAASAVTALDEDEGAVPVAAGPATVAAAADAPVPEATPESAPAGEADADKPDGVLAAAAASAGAFLAGVAGYGVGRKSNSPSPPNEKVEPEADAAVPDEVPAAAESVVEGDAAVPEEPAAAVKPNGLAPALNLADVDPMAAEEGEVTAVERGTEWPSKTKAIVTEVPVVAPLKTTKSPKTKRASTVKESAAVKAAAEDSKPLDRSKSTAAATHTRSPSGGRLINYSKRDKKGPSGVEAVAPVTTTTATASSPEEEDAAVLSDAGAPLASVVEDAPAATETEVSAAPVAAPPSSAAKSSSKLKKRSSLPAVRQSVDGAQSIRSTGSKGRKFRTLSFLGGRKVEAGDAALAPEEEEWAIAAERKAANRRSSLFRKGGSKKADAAPPLPAQFREKIALESGAASPVEEPVKRTTATRAAETSVFDEDDAPPKTRGGLLSRKEKAPKAPKAPKEPKEPKERLSFKQKMSHLMTME